MLCEKCGSVIAPGEKFCGNCGARVEEATMLVNDDDYATVLLTEQPEHQQPVQPQSTPPAQPVYSQPEQSQYAQPVQPMYGQPVQPQYVQPVQPMYSQPVQPQYVQPVYPPTEQPMNASMVMEDPEMSNYASKALGFGIAALCCCLLPVLGIVFGVIAKINANAFHRRCRIFGKANAGRIMANIGFIVGIIANVYWLIALIAVFAAALNL